MLNNLHELVQHYDGELYNLLYKVVCESEKLSEDFQYICENLIKDKTDKTVAISQEISTYEYDKIVTMCEDLIEGILNSVIKTAIYGLIEENAFYEVLCRKYRAAFENDKELAVALEFALKDDRIPFVYLGKPLSMDQEEYKERIDRNRDSIQKIHYALNTDYSQKTEGASVILNILQNVADYKDRVVVLSQLITVLTHGRVSKLQELLSKLKDTD